MLKTLWTGDNHEEWVGKFKQYLDPELKAYAISGLGKDKLNEEQLIESLKGKEVYLCGYDKVTRNVLQNAPDLKLILSVRDGPEENIDINACTELGIPVISSAGRCAVSVAEYTFLLMLCLARPVINLSNQVRAGNWTVENNQNLRNSYQDTASELFRKNLGIIGFGRNARKLAKLADAFGMHIEAYDPYVTEEQMQELNVTKKSLEDVVKDADYLIVLARLTPETEKILSRELIGMMKPSASIVNTGRAKLIDNEAVYDALVENKIRSAAIDVHEVEPLGAESKWYDIPLEKLIITPHAAGCTVERPYHQYELLFAQLEDYLNGKRPVGTTNRNVYDTPQFAERGGKLFGMNK